jgi:MFS family permease
MGIALTAGTVAEIPVLFFGDRLIRWFKAYGLFVLTIVITAGRLLALGAVNTPELILLFQLFNGLTFPAMWMAGVAYANENAPRGMSATSQGVFGMVVFGFGGAAGNFIGGPMLTGLGGQWLFIIFGIVVLVTVAAVMFLEHWMRIEPETESVS